MFVLSHSAAMTAKPEPQIGDLLLSPVSQITDREYEAFRKIVYDHSRINLGSNKKELVNARIIKRLRATKIPTFSAYLEFIQSKAGEDEFTNFIDAISTNHTFFFRESAHYDFLNREVFPSFFDGKLKWGNQLRI